MICALSACIVRWWIVAHPDITPVLG
jgi:hypothetical protein